MDVIKVSARSRTSAVAGAIAGVFREHGRAEVQAIGAGAVNQSVKALVLATSYLKERDGIDVACVPEFVDVEIEDKVRTAIKLVVERKEGGSSDELDELDQLDQPPEDEVEKQLMDAPESDLLDPSAFD
ncbi:MAG: stage V sporulation protein S [Anaerolineae bacterium]|jgi:stage V sporulation protein S|nr:stage V sporulation protein S [Anaerolineae bacterium]MBT3711954.1 stage V sporulation protein S [Anaerolineae bacterium]MBT4310915.1 stage V sporulation protein S [Anaerolineae bacterium]MBT4457765.1 stage V sporulation protein S [Anaerolineae bacterium]MBT4843403.1 stage V sporulation protein S [Anaerolineae bacterium]